MIKVIFLLFFLFSEISFGQERGKVLFNCDQLSRSIIKENYLRNISFKLISLTSWLASENSLQKVYRFASIAKIRDKDNALYSWTFSSIMFFNGNECVVEEQKLVDIVKLIEDDNDDSENVSED